MLDIEMHIFMPAKCMNHHFSVLNQKKGSTHEILLPSWQKVLLRSDSSAWWGQRGL